MSTFPQITSPPQASAEVVVNEALETLEHQAVYGKDHATTTGLVWGYYGGRWGGFSIAAGTVTLSGSATNYLVVEIATGALTKSTSSTNWDDGTNYVRVYKITTTTVVSAVEDHRAGPGGVHGGAGSGVSSGTVTNIDASGGVQTTTGSAITTTGTFRGAHVINAQTGTTYAIVSGDRWKHVTLANASSIAVTIAQAGTTGFENGYGAFVENIGIGAVTITPTTSTINGATTLLLDGGMSAILFSDGTNYRAIVIDPAGRPVNLQTGTSYSVLSSDRGKLVTHTNALTIAIALPQATGAFGAGWYYFVQNRGAGTATITPTTSTIDGAASLALTTGQGVLVASDGTNYYTMRGLPGAATLAAFTEALNTASPNNTVNVSSLSASGGTTSQGMALKWKGGSGYLALDIPDSTSAGGNVRGVTAVDLQKTRSTAAQIASGTSAALIGTSASTASGQNAVCVAATAAVASGDQALAQGNTTLADAANSVAMGNFSSTRGITSLAFASGGATAGDAQIWMLTLRRNSSFSATPVQLTTSNGAPSGTNIPVLPNTSSALFRVYALQSDGTDNFAVEIVGAITRGANAASTALLGTPTVTTIGASAGVAGKLWAFTATADTTNGGLAITMTPDAGSVNRGVCSVTMMQNDF